LLTLITTLTLHLPPHSRALHEATTLRTEAEAGLERLRALAATAAMYEQQVALAKLMLDDVRRAQVCAGVRLVATATATTTSTTATTTTTTATVLLQLTNACCVTFPIAAYALGPTTYPTNL
jgi:predicted S18 family serine protease